MSVVAGVDFGLDPTIDGAPRRRTPRRGRVATRPHLRAVPLSDLHERQFSETTAVAPCPVRDAPDGGPTPAVPASTGLVPGAGLDTGLPGAESDAGLPVAAGSGSARRRPVAEVDATSPVPTRGWRLTRRGRAVVLGLLVVLLTAGTVGFGAARALSASTAPVERRVEVVVAEGDTLWTIAAAVAPRGDRKETVERIRKVNHLRGSHIEPGQQLVVPVAGR